MEGATRAPKIEWANFLFITLTPVVAIVGTIWTLKNNGFFPETLVWTVVMMFLTGLGITAGYHRLFSHRSYKTTWFVKLMYLLFGLSISPLHPQHMQPYVTQMAEQPALVTGPTHVIPFSNTHMLPAILQSTHTG